VAIEELSTLASSSNCALLCFEADFNYCHRSMVADAVKQQNGMRVSHIRVDQVRTTKPADFELAFA
jgi:uncharacterized protein (DUF488 family)